MRTDSFIIPRPHSNNKNIETLAGRNRHMAKTHAGQSYQPSGSMLHMPDPRQARRRVGTHSPNASAPQSSRARNKQPVRNAGQERSASRGRLHNPQTTPQSTAALSRVSSSAPPPRSRSATSLPSAPSLPSRSVSTHSDWSFESPSPSSGPSRPRRRARRAETISGRPIPRSASSSSNLNRPARELTPLFQTDPLRQALEAAAAARRGESPFTAGIPAKRARRLSTLPEVAEAAASLTARSERARGRDAKKRNQER